MAQCSRREAAFHGCHREGKRGFGEGGAGVQIASLIQDPLPVQFRGWRTREVLLHGTFVKIKWKPSSSEGK